eukprot:scaffold2563_cov105-Isochrysis_galbana.AAC.2
MGCMGLGALAMRNTARMGSSASGGKEKLGGSLMGHNGGENESEVQRKCGGSAGVPGVRVTA